MTASWVMVNVSALHIDSLRIQRCSGDCVAVPHIPGLCHTALLFHELS